MEGTSLDPDATTRGQQKKLADISEEDASPAKKPRMSKATTMVNTAKVLVTRVNLSILSETFIATST